MKKTLISFLSFLAIMVLFAACKKDDPPPPPKTTAEKIQAKWTLSSSVYNDHTGGVDDIYTEPGLPGEYLDFRADGKVYSYFSGSRDTLNYAIQGDTKVLIDGGVFDIQTLTDTDLKLYTKEPDLSNPADYYESTLNLKK